MGSEHQPDNLISEDFVHLESIRGIAAFGVVLNHSRGILWEGGVQASTSGSIHSYNILEWLFYVLNQFTRCGYELVVLFFVLSGFSIAHSLRYRSGPSSAKAFYLRRLVRLYPPYVAGLTFAIAVSLFLLLFPSLLARVEYLGMAKVVLGQLNIRSLLHNLLYDPTVPFVAQYWSLGHEVVFYLLAPWLIRLKKTFAIAAGLLWAVGAVLAYLPGFTQGESFWALYLMKYEAYFAVGIVLYRYYPQWHRSLQRFSNLKLLLAIAFLFCSMVVLSKVLAAGRATEMLAVSIALLAIPLVLRSRPRFRLLRWLGEQSYSLYVTHIATIALVLGAVTSVDCGYPIRSPYLWLVAPPFCLLVSRVVYQLVEVNTRTLLAALRQRSSVPVAATSEVSFTGAEVADDGD